MNLVPSRRVTPLRKLSENSFVRGVAAVAGGTAAAQAIGIAFSPIVTRLYGPEAFGVLGVFSATIAVVTPIITFTYASAIALPKDDTDAVHLGFLSVAISFWISAISLPLLIFFRRAISGLFGYQEIEGFIWLLAPLFLFLGADQILTNWLIRKKSFFQLGMVQVGQATILGLLKVTLGFFYPVALSLVTVVTLGWIGKASFLLFASRRTGLKGSIVQVVAGKTRRREIAYSFIDFPAYRAPQNLLNSMSRNLPIILFSTFFGPAVAGLYGIGHRVMQLPLRLISVSVGKVILPRLAEAVNRGDPIRPIILKTTLGLAGIGVVPFFLVVLFGPEAFSIAFGVEWHDAGVYARWLVPWLFLGFINVPAVQSLSLSQSYRFLLIWEVLTTMVKTGILVAGGVLLKDILVTIRLYSLFGATMYLLLIVEGYRRAGKLSRMRTL